MISGRAAISCFEEAGVELFVGVPDSLMKGFCTALDDWSGKAVHIVAANEGAAVGVAAGHYLAKGSPAVVYLQNSGLGNAVNPLTSLATRSLYGVPMVLMVGWRGQPGVADEPQHEHQGRITQSLLELVDVPFTVVGPDNDFAFAVTQSVQDSVASAGPVALLVEKGTIESDADSGDNEAAITRLEAIDVILSTLPDTTTYVATTGYTGRELALLRDERAESWDHDFLMVGSMGHASAISLGLAQAVPDRLVCCLDGDGGAVMHLGTLATISGVAPRNLLHVVLNNAVHESVGGQASSAAGADWVGLGQSLGYRHVAKTSTGEGLAGELEAFEPGAGPWLVEVEIAVGSVERLPRPDSFRERMADLMHSLSNG